MVLSHSGNPRSDWEKKQRHYGPPCDLWSAGACGVRCPRPVAAHSCCRSSTSNSLPPPPIPSATAGIVLYMLLAGSPPFYDQSEPRLLRRIMAGQFEFDASIWKPVSAAAKDLIRKLLVVDPAKRLTCEQVHVFGICFAGRCLWLAGLGEEMGILTRRACLPARRCCNTHG